MCPDRELLSAYVDGEVPEPWNGRLAGHIAHCDACTKVVEAVRSLSLRIQATDLSAEGLDESAVLTRMGSRLDEALAARGKGERPAPSTELWRRRVALPLPAAAAAALVVAALLALAISGGFSFSRRGAPALAAASQLGQIQATAAAAELPAAGNSQNVNMDDLLRYLDSKNDQAALTIRLPSGASFDNSGTAVLQVAAPPPESKGGAQ
ncbi:MAG: anti-sigma factor family protein [Rectinemataceae bacterium]